MRLNIRPPLIVKGSAHRNLTSCSGKACFSTTMRKGDRKIDHQPVGSTASVYLALSNRLKRLSFRTVQLPRRIFKNKHSKHVGSGPLQSTPILQIPLFLVACCKCSRPLKAFSTLRSGSARRSRSSPSRPRWKSRKFDKPCADAEDERRTRRTR